MILFLVYDSVSGGHQRAIIWLLLPRMASFIALVIHLLLICFLDDHLVFTTAHIHLVREELLALSFKLLTIFFVLCFLDKIDAVELALPVDQVVALELIDLTFLG